MLNRPSVVSHIGNPTADVSVHEWVPTNVKSMNRTNKLSSVPFYIPNDKQRKHQFRLVLLRGVVKAPEGEEKDPLAVYLEYLPPASDGQPIEGPGNCKVSVWCLNRYAAEEEEAEAKQKATTGEASTAGSSSSPTTSSAAIATAIKRGSPHRYDETTFNFTATDRMVGFKDLIHADDLGNEAIVDPNAFNAMTIRLEITTHVVSVVEVVSKATDRWAATFWGSATSAFQAIQTGLETIKSQVMSTVDERSEAGGGDHNTSGVEQRALPWEELPQAWQKAGRTLAEWEKLVTSTIVEDDNTFLYGADRGLHPDEQVLMTQLGLNHKLIMNASTLFDYDRDVHEGLLTVDAIRKQRYNFVPKLIKDKAFWANYMWKVAALSTAPKDDQIHLLMSIVNAPPRIAKVSGGAAGGATSGARGTAAATSAAVSSGIAAVVGGFVSATSIMTGVGANADGDDTGRPASPPINEDAVITHFQKEVAAVVKLSLEAAELLQELAEDQAEDVLMATAVQSCKSCNAKMRDVATRIDGYISRSDALTSGLSPLKDALLKTSAQLKASVLGAKKGGANNKAAAAEPVAAPAVVEEAPTNAAAEVVKEEPSDEAVGEEACNETEPTTVAPTPEVAEESPADAPAEDDAVADEEPTPQEVDTAEEEAAAPAHVDPTAMIPYEKEEADAHPDEEPVTGDDASPEDASAVADAPAEEVFPDAEVGTPDEADASPIAAEEPTVECEKAERRSEPVAPEEVAEASPAAEEQALPSEEQQADATAPIASPSPADEARERASSMPTTQASPAVPTSTIDDDDDMFTSPKAKEPASAKAEGIKPTALSTASSASASVKRDTHSLDFLDDDFLDSSSPAGTTSKFSTTASAPRATSTASKKIEFEPMPWDDEE